MSKHGFDPLCRSGFDIDANEDESHLYEEWLVVYSADSGSIREECNAHALVKSLNEKETYSSSRYYTDCGSFVVLVDPECDTAIKTAQLLVEFITAGNDLDPAEYLKALDEACRDYWLEADFSVRVDLLMRADGDIGLVVKSDPPDVVMPFLQERHE
jgi:hypothetical protein